MLQKFISKGAQFHSAARANVKFPEGTVAGLYKAAVAAKPEYDCMRVDSQGINWSLKELDVSNSQHRSDILNWSDSLIVEIQFCFCIWST